MIKKAFVDKDTCIGCTVCSALAPTVFTVKEDPQYGNEFKSTADEAVDQVPIESAVQEAIDTCPVSCISWREKEEKNEKNGL